MAIWRASKPVIAQVHGWCVGGASDYALCADIVIASDDAVIGTPYARMWGAYLTGMWLYRLSLAKAKWHSLTGEPLTGKEAAASNSSTSRSVRAAGGPRRRDRREAAPNSVVAVAGAEADRQPGLREHGPGVDPDPRRHPRRVDAQHPGRTGVHRHRRQPKGCGPRSSAATARGATTARPRRSGGPTRRTSSSPRAGPQVQQGVEIADRPQRVVEVRARAGADELATDPVAHLRQRHSADRVALPMAPGHSCHGSTRTSAAPT